MLLTDIHSFAFSTRRALVLGNDSYLHANRLANARNDARAVGVSLHSLGYVTTVALDTDRAGMALSIERFVESIGTGDAAIVYYAGHGLQIEGENYLVPTDFQVADPTDAKVQGYSLSALLEKLVSHGATTQIVILDACRDNPFIAVRGLQNGWARTATSAGSFLAFGTSPGSTASDDPNDTHGLFTKFLLHYMTDPSLDIEQMFQQVRKEVIRSSNEQQVPWTASSLVGSFHMVPTSDSAVPSIDGVYSGSGVTEVGTGRSLSPTAVLMGNSMTEQHMMELLNEAKSDLRAFHFEDALTVLRAVLSVDPRCMVALRLLGVVLHLTGRNVEAEQALSKVIEQDPQDYTAYAYRCLIRAGHQAVESEEDCHRALQLHEELALAHLGLAINLFTSGNAASAYAEASRAVSLEPEAAAGFALRGRIAASQGRTRISEQDYMRATELAILNDK